MFGSARIKPDHPRLCGGKPVKYESPKGQFPKIQILTIEDLLSSKSKPQYFDMSGGSLNFKKAKTEEKRADQHKLEGF